ncbi:hypothetical protein GGF46_001788 [Coemansia sp. RSA 552]|nr:hypothetical protein GGF46_001788 [Coemansia sp. RSA 552]
MADAQAPSDDKAVVLITRVGSWIGAEEAVHFLKRGVTVIGVGRDPARVSRLCSALERHTAANSEAGKFIPLIGVLTSTETQDEVIEHINREGRLTAIVHNTGAYETDEFADSPPVEQWERLQRALLEALPLFHRIRHILRRCKSRVIHVASDDGSQIALPANVALVAIKTAVNLHMAELALLEPHVTSLAVHPGIGLSFTRGPAADDQESTADKQAGHAPRTDRLQPAGELIVDLALTADHSMSGQYYMYSEPDFLKN